MSEPKLSDISRYIDILLRWNARINLTAVREPEEIVRRHFGESLFAARHLFPEIQEHSPVHVIDVGSGAGFPGIPIKLWFPAAKVTLIESNQKKVAFLREVIRSLTLMDINVFGGRCADYNGPLGDVVTLRAVEKFGDALPLATGLVAQGGRLALLIGESQVSVAQANRPTVSWMDPAHLPGSSSRVLLLGRVDIGRQEST